MILSLNFLRDYLELEKDIDVKNVAEAMTKVGNEYDSASKLINATKLVIGQVDMNVKITLIQTICMFAK